MQQSGATKTSQDLCETQATLPERANLASCEASCKPCLGFQHLALYSLCYWAMLLRCWMDCFGESVVRHKSVNEDSNFCPRVFRRPVGSSHRAAEPKPCSSEVARSLIRVARLLGCCTCDI